jgi:chromosome segregation ATPase
MELDQIIKQVDWLDDEHRKDKSALLALEERLASLEANLPTMIKQIKDLDGETTRLAAMLTRMDHFDENLLQFRVESKHALEELEKASKQRDEESEKVRRVEHRAVESSIVELRKELAPISELKRGIQARVDEDTRLSRSIDEVRVRVDTIRRSEEEYTRTLRLIDDGRRQDAKRLTDLQGEVSAIRKHVDDQRGRMELTSNSMRKIEARLNEIAMVDAERRESLAKFLEEQALQQVERDRVWKEWQARFDNIESQTADIEVNLQNLDTTHRNVKRSQQALDELAAKVDRRINEMTEIQRLAEERFRQEWITFKADDQKRWTNYTLTQEEQRNESTRQYEKLVDRVTHIEDSIQEIQDSVQQISDQTGKRLQALLAVVHEWVTTFERSTGKVR